MRAKEVVEEVEAPPGRLGWDTVAGLLGEALEGYSTRRLDIGPGAAIGMEDLVAALEAMGYPLTGRRVVLTVVHGYGGQLTPDSAPRGANQAHEEPHRRVKTGAKEARVNARKIEEAEA